jgi:hypothetical protein
MVDYDPSDIVRRFDAMRGQLVGGLAPVQPPPQVRAIPYGGSLPGPAAPSGAGLQAGGHWQQLRSQFPGLQETSGYRDPQHNAEVGGVPNSYHTQLDDEGNSRAYDFVGSAADMQAAAAWAKQNGATEVLIHNAGSGQHLHIAW